MTQTFRTFRIIDIVSTTIPIIIIAGSVVGLIVAETVFHKRMISSCTSLWEMTQTFRTICKIEIVSTTITTIIIAGSIVYFIVAETVSQ
jgi:hypothetical protein